MGNLSVSVVVPVYNASKTLGTALESVLAQTRPAEQIIVIDDGSTDALSDLRTRYRSRVQWLWQNNAGTAAARNRGIDHATGDLVTFLDADDVWEPHKLERQLSIFAGRPEVGLCCSNYFEQVPDTNRYAAGCRIGRHPLLDRVHRHRGRNAFDAACCVWTGTVMVRRTLLEDERFESGLEPAEDRDLWIRLIQKCSSIHLSDRLATAVLVPGSLSRTQIDRDCGNMIRVVERWPDLLGPSGRLFWKRRLLRRWAAEYLGCGDPRSAVQPAIRRLSLQPWSPEAWWIVGKSVSLSLGAGNRVKSC